MLKQQSFVGETGVSSPGAGQAWVMVYGGRTLPKIHSTSLGRTEKIQRNTEYSVWQCKAIFEYQSWVGSKMAEGKSTRGRLLECGAISSLVGIGALASIPTKLITYIDWMEIKHSIPSFQKSALLNIAYIPWKILDIWWRTTRPLLKKKKTKTKSIKWRKYNNDNIKMHFLSPQLRIDSYRLLCLL